MTIKVLFPVLHYPPVIGGFEIFIQNLAEKLGQELPVWVVTGRVQDVVDEETDQQLKIIRTSPTRLANLSYSSKFYILSTLPWILFKSWRLIQREGINLIHCHGFFSGLLGLLLSKMTGVPYVMTIQSADLNIYHPNFPGKLLKIIYWLERKIYQNASQCHSVSVYLKNYYASRGVQNSVVIPNGVDQELFKPVGPEWRNQRAELGFNSEEKIIVSVSRLEKKNGTEDLIRALLNLKIEDYKLLIIGDGTERKFLENLVKELALSNKVKFLGAMDITELPKYLQISNLFVRVPLAEGFGIVFIEAMACGVPVIGTPVGGITDIIVDKKTGLFCRVNNPQDVAMKINDFFADNNCQFTLRDNGLRLVQEKYQWPDVVNKIKELYLQIIDSSFVKK